MTVFGSLKEISNSSSMLGGILTRASLRLAKSSALVGLGYIRYYILKSRKRLKMDKVKLGKRFLKLADWLATCGDCDACLVQKECVILWDRMCGDIKVDLTPHQISGYKLAFIKLKERTKYPKLGNDLKSYEEKQDLRTRKQIDDLKAMRK